MEVPRAPGALRPFGPQPFPFATDFEAKGLIRITSDFSRDIFLVPYR